MTARDWIYVEAVLAMMLLLLWVAPWVEVPGNGVVYGYELPPALRDIDRLSDAISGTDVSRFNPFLLIYLLPVGCVATLFQSAVKIDTTLVAASAGITPIAALSYAYGELGSDLIRMLHPAAYVAIMFAGMVVVLTVAVKYPHGTTTRVRNYAALALFVLAPSIAGTIGFLKRS